MKKILLLSMITVASFATGFAVRSFTVSPDEIQEEQPRVTGIGGIFFTCKDPQEVQEWYAKNLHLNMNAYGAVFEWYEGNDSTKKGMTQWALFPKNTKYFEPSGNNYMINYRVNDLEGLIEQFVQNGVTIVDTMETYEYGKFIHILDLEGNKVELWEPMGE